MRYFKFRIPTSISDIKLLYLEKCDKEFAKRRDAYCRLEQSILSELKRGRELTVDELVRTFKDYFGKRFRNYEAEILGYDRIDRITITDQIKKLRK